MFHDSYICSNQNPIKEEFPPYELWSETVPNHFLPVEILQTIHFLTQQAKVEPKVVFQWYLHLINLLSATPHPWSNYSLHFCITWTIWRLRLFTLNLFKKNRVEFFFSYISLGKAFFQNKAGIHRIITPSFQVVFLL